MIVILPYPEPETHFSRLCNFSFKSLVVLDATGNQCERLGDLSADDELIVMASSRALTASRKGLRCRTNLLLQEPRAIKPLFHRLCSLYSHRFDRIVTHSREIVSRVPNAVFAPHGGAFVPKTSPFQEKSSLVSLIASPKRSTDGHRLRHEIAAWSTGHPCQLTIFGKDYKPLPEKSAGHLPFQFSVVIENSRAEGYFTEKLIDCFLCYCVPIYWGAPDIQEFFDPRGMICCNSKTEIQNRLKNLSHEKFEQYLPFVQQNRLKALEFADFYLNAATSIRQAALKS